VKRNFNELFSKMKPEAQGRARARSGELLQEMALADQCAEIEGAKAAGVALTPSTDAKATSSDEASPDRASAIRKVVVQSSK
jgi:hypothetical protein